VSPTPTKRATTTSTPEQFVLLGCDPCDAHLPVNKLRDDHLIDRLAPITLVAGTDWTNASPAMAVVPRDVVLPGLAETYAGLAPHATRLELRGGVGLVDRWNTPAELQPLPDEALAPEVHVDDLDALLARGMVKIEGTEGRVLLDPDAIQALLAQGRAVVTAQVGEERRLLTLVAGPVPGAAEQEGERLFAVTDLPRFLSDPRLAIPGGTVDVRLEARNVQELRTSGATQVEASDGTGPVTIVSRPAADPGDGLAALGESDAAAAIEPAFAAQVGPRPLRATTTGSRPVTSTETFPTYQLALYLPFRQTWELLGYSRGPLISSLSLAPQEETTIEIFSWDRRKTTTEVMTGFEFEATSEDQKTTKDSYDVLNEMSHDSSFHMQADGHLSAEAEGVGLSLGGGVGSSDAIKNLAKQTHTHIQETLQKSSARMKLNRQTKVSEAVEVGREERVTRKVRNANMCHTLNVDYFEILTNYKVHTGFAVSAAKLCVLVNNPVKLTADRQLLRVWEHVLRPALLAPNLAGGFDAARFLAARDRACATACDRCTCLPGSGPATMDEATAWQEIVKQLKALGTRDLSMMLANPDDFIDWADGKTVDHDLARRNIRLWLFHKVLNGYLWNLASPLAELGTEAAAGSTVKAESKDFAADLWTTVKALAEDALDLGKLWNDHKTYLFAAFVTRLTQRVGSNTAKWYKISAIAAAEIDSVDDNGIVAAIGAFKSAYQAYLDVRAADEKLLDEMRANAVKYSDAATAATAEAFPLKQVTEAQEREEALLAHITENGAYYRYALWRALDEGAKWQLLQSLGQLARLVEPGTIGFFGDKLAFPLDVAADPQLAQWFEENVTKNPSLADLGGDQRVTLPTPGVYVETRLGACDGCEDFIRAQRTLDLKAKEIQNRAATAVAEQQEQEAARYEARLKHHPPILDDPEPDHAPAPIRIILERPPQP
jgi:hypothetical protein